MSKKTPYVVALKDSRPGQPIKPGKELGKYRAQEFADRDFHKLAKRAGVESWHVGIFLNGELVS